jgi:uncharacterized protein (TIGR02145 family)
LSALQSNTTYNVTSLTNNTTYYWQIFAKDDHSHTTAGLVWKFTTIAGGTAPTTPLLSSPSNGLTNQSTSPILSWNVSSGATSYTLQVSANSSFSSFIYNQSGLTNTSQQISGLSNSTTYYWKVNATNSYGTSSYSSTWNFTTVAVGTAPATPTLSSPANNAPNVAIPPTLSWNASTGATSYSLQVSTSNSFSSYVYNQSGLTNTSQQISGLSNSITYWWRVTATNSYGSSTSSTWSFTTSSGNSNGPILSTPQNGAINLDYRAIYFSWGAVQGASGYMLRFADNEDFNNSATATAISETNQTIANQFAKNTKYFWKVRAYIGSGYSDWSETWWFITGGDGTSPSTPTLSSPANNAPYVAIPPTLSWNAASGATSYMLQVSTSSSFTSFIYNQSGLTSTSQQISGLNNSTAYYWRVNATNNYGTSGWSTPTWSFTTASGTSGGSSCVGVPTVSYQGKTYNTVQIGTQCWLQKNLDVGTMIQVNQDASNNGTIEKYCYNNDANNCATYGGLYQWNEAMAYSTAPGTKGICPDGWHIPTKTEFETLGTAVSNNSNALKAIGQGTGSGIGTNTSGFSALLAGYRNNNSNFNNLGNNTNFWSSTENNSNNAYNMNLWNNDSNINMNNNNKNNGFSVRCVKDSKPLSRCFF